MAFRIDTAALRSFAKAARSSDAAVAARLRIGLRTAGDLVADEARRRADWSSRIPGTVTVTVRGPSARVSAGGESAPHAAAYENQGREGVFRHPVNAWARSDRAEWKWASQQARPFLAVSLEMHADEAAEIIAGSVEQGFLSVLP